MPHDALLSRMFSRFVERKTSTPIAHVHHGVFPPRLPVRHFPNDIPYLLNPLPSISTLQPPHQHPQQQQQARLTPIATYPAPPLPPSRTRLLHTASNISSSNRVETRIRKKTGRRSGGGEGGAGVGSVGGGGSVHARLVRGRSCESVNAIAMDSTSVPTPFHCEKCSKAFRQRSQLSRHFLRVHERRKPFACAHCDKCFASAFDRKRHVEAVHGRRCIEFFCDRCSFRSKKEEDLSKHIREIHERDQCRLCGKVFKRPANLVAHERHYHSKSV